LIGVEGGHSIGRSLAALRVFADIGVRYMTLTHTANVAWADSGTDTPQLGGLNDEGLAVIAEMNRLGVLVDLSHTSPDTQRAAIAASRAPVIFSHSSAATVNPHPRNVDDDVLRLLSAADGVAMVTFVPDFVLGPAAEWSAGFEKHLASQGIAFDFALTWKSAPRPGETPAETIRRNAEPVPGAASAVDFAALLARWEEKHPRPRAVVADVVAHVEHIREVAGIEHIGLGGDYDGTFFQPDGLEDVSTYPKLLAALAERGWSKSDLAALTSGNILRVLEAAQEAADPR
jgi:membrane dipeptidase